MYYLVRQYKSILCFVGCTYGWSFNIMPTFEIQEIFFFNPDFQLLLKDVRRKKTFRYQLGSPQASSLSAYAGRHLSSLLWIYSYSSLNGFMFIYRPLDTGAELPKYSSKALSAPSHSLCFFRPQNQILFCPFALFSHSSREWLMAFLDDTPSNISIHLSP